MTRSSVRSASRSGALLLSDIVSWLFSIVLALGLAVVSRLVLENVLRFPAADDVPRILLIFVSAFFILIVRSWSLGHYSQYRPFWVELQEVFSIVLWIAAFISFLLFVIGVTFSRLWFGHFLLVSVVLVPVGREMTKMWLIKTGFWYRNTFVVGTGINAQNTTVAMESDSSLGTRVVGYIDLSGTSVPMSSLNGRPVFDSIESARKKYRDGNRANIVFAFETVAELNASKPLMDYHIANSPYVSVVPPKLELPLYGADIVGIFRHDTTLLKLNNNLNDKRAQLLKRGFDLLVGLVICSVVLPFCLVIATLIKRDGGPVFFSHSRIGKQGKQFACWKFRTMVVDAENAMSELFRNNPQAEVDWLNRRKLKEDPRVTKVGRFLRRSSLDELPQLYNVLKGQMSLVGPRPIVEDERPFYGDSYIYYKTMTPGMTGLWQVSGRTETTYAERVRLDVWYSRNWSLWNDFVILVKTVKTVLQRHGAY